ncbi:MAG: addiction module protein [Desulfuromonadales bacterium]
MSASNDLEKMTIEEKIRAMESLWDDLCRHAPDKLTQTWHEEVLLQRERAESVGEAQFIDWDAAKKKLRESL